jgi:hypothetical protein
MPASINPASFINRTWYSKVLMTPLQKGLFSTQRRKGAKKNRKKLGVLCDFAART